MAEVTTSSLPILVFAPFGKDAALIESVLRQSSVSSRLVARFEELEMSISEDAGAAIITEEVLQNGAISALAQKLSAQPSWSDFPIIVLTGRHEHRLDRIGSAISRSPGKHCPARAPLAPRYPDQCRTYGPDRAAPSIRSARSPAATVGCRGGSPPRTRCVGITCGTAHGGASPAFGETASRAG